MLPTNQKADIFIGKTYNVLHYKNNIPEEQFKDYQHLYILSYNEIKAIDWALNPRDPTGNIVQCNKSNCESIQEHWNKIIATTDPSLVIKLEKIPVMKGVGLSNQYGIKTCLPSIPQPFIERYVEEYNKGNKIEYVMVEYNYFENDTSECIGMDGVYNGIPFNGYVLKLNSDNTINIKPVKDIWTREEIIELLHQYDLNGTCNTDIDFNKWIDNNL